MILTAERNRHRKDYLLLFLQVSWLQYRAWTHQQEVSGLKSWNYNFWLKTKKRWHGRECQIQNKSVIFSPWNSLEVKNLNYKTQAYQTIIKYYRENSCKAIKH